jgi:Ca2+-binding EF-hand superfamily protein
MGMEEPDVPDPKTHTTKEFYKSQGKRIKAPTANVSKRQTMLEDNKWTDHVFTGDTANFQADLTTKVKKRVNKLGLSHVGKLRVGKKEDLSPSKTQRQSSKTAEDMRPYAKAKIEAFQGATLSKADLHATADQETQLVRLDHRKTLEGKVDLKKVRDIRRAIRRRYATRKNASKLFHAWDLKQQKKIDTEDVVNMVNKMGIKINKNEAYVLLKSADINADDFLDIEEFINLIHSTNEALDVNLRELAPLSNEINKKGERDLKVIEKLQQKASNQYEKKLDNQMRLFMQKSSQTIARDCLSEDQGEKTYKIDKQKLKAIMKHRLQLPEMLKNDPERLDKIISEYCVDDNNEVIDYRIMLDDLRCFNYNVETQGNTDRKVISPRQTESEYSEQSNTGRNSLTILDIQKVPFNKEEEIKAKSSKINRLLKKRFKTKDALTRHLKEKIDVDKNGIIDLNEFQNLIIGSFQEEIENNDVGRKDIEAFLSNFVYNKYGYTAVDEVAPRVFASAEDYNRIIDHFKKPKPPPSKVNDGLIQEDTGNVIDKFYQQRVKNLADKIVTKALNAAHSKYQCFKSFDIDGDGYVSYQDFVNKVKEMEIQASNNEIMSVVKAIDTDKNGFIDFRNFMISFQPNLPEITEDNGLPYLRNKTLLGSVNGSVVPSTELVKKQMGRCKSTKSRFMATTNSFKASSDIHMNLKPSTRFSATPQWKNTFTHYHMDPQSAGFISENERFKKTENSLHAKNQFQMEDKLKKNKIYENKISKKRDIFGRLDDRAYQNDMNFDQFDQSRLNHKAAIVQNYERMCHSRVI